MCKPTYTQTVPFSVSPSLAHTQHTHTHTHTHTHKHTQCHCTVHDEGLNAGLFLHHTCSTFGLNADCRSCTMVRSSCTSFSTSPSAISSVRFLCANLVCVHARQRRVNEWLDSILRNTCGTSQAHSFTQSHSHSLSHLESTYHIHTSHTYTLTRTHVHHTHAHRHTHTRY